MLITGCLACGRVYVGAAVAVVSLLPVIHAARLLKTLVWGRSTPASAKASATPAGMWVPMVLLAAALLLSGLVWTLLFDSLVSPAVAAILPLQR